MAKTKDELNAIKEEVQMLNKNLAELTDEELGQVAGGNAGNDTESLKFSGKTVPLPKARYKKEIDGGYAGKIVTEIPDSVIK